MHFFHRHFAATAARCVERVYQALQAQDLGARHGRSIALALIKDGRQRMGENVHVALEGRTEHSIEFLSATRPGLLRPD